MQIFVKALTFGRRSLQLSRPAIPSTTSRRNLTVAVLFSAAQVQGFVSPLLASIVEASVTIDNVTASVQTPLDTHASSFDVLVLAWAV